MDATAHIASAPSRCVGRALTLPQLFGEVLLTDVIAPEIVSGGVFPDCQALQDALAQPWMQTVTLPDTALETCRDWINLHQIDTVSGLAVSR